MPDEIKKATPEQILEAQKLLVMANLPPDTRLECDGILALGLEPQVAGLITNLQNLISEKEAAYAEYKNTVKENLISTKKDTGQ